MKTILPVLLVLSVAISCASRQTEQAPAYEAETYYPTAREAAPQEDQYVDAAITAGVAATAQVVQKAKSKDPDVEPMGEFCCARCTEGYFPCGDKCRPVGLFPPCLEPPGCACMDGEQQSTMPPEDQNPPPPQTTPYPTAD